MGCLLWLIGVLLTITAASTVPDDRVIAVSSVSFESEPATVTALAALATAALAASDIKATVADLSNDCKPPHVPDSARCLNATLRALAWGTVQAAVLPIPAARPPHPLLLRDAGLEDLGDAAPPTRRSCAPISNVPTPARSLLDIADANVAALHHVPREILDAALKTSGSDRPLGIFCGGRASCKNRNFTQLQCNATNTPLATFLTSDQGETQILADIICEWRLHAQIFALGAYLSRVVDELRTNGSTAIICDRALPKAMNHLAPPPCLSMDCPFESRRIMKLVNARELAHSPSAFRILGRLSLNDVQLQDLLAKGRNMGTEKAARLFIEAHPNWTDTGGEVRVAVMVPASTHRQAYDYVALRAAAELAEMDLRNDSVNGVPRPEFKVELIDDGCSATLPYKYLTDALGTEYGALSAVAGPACFTAFADVARQSPTLLLPILAYTAQAPPATAGGLALLAAGDIRLYADTWGAFMEYIGWSRMAILSEFATRNALDVARFRSDVIVHVELNPDEDIIDGNPVVEWAERAAAANGRILYVCVEDARMVRAALCAGRNSGLTPEAGSVWVLPAHLPTNWLHPTENDPHNCSFNELSEVADGHFSVAPEWYARWEGNGSNNELSKERKEWESRWCELCARIRHVKQGEYDCARPNAHAAVLYDVLSLWATVLRQLVTAHPSAVDDLHRPVLVVELVENAIKSKYAGLTGTFEWTSGSTHARTDPVILLQWRNDSRVEVGKWSNGELDIQQSALQWLTVDAQIPDDGAEHCSLQPLADLLSADCQAAFIALASLLIIIAVSALAVLAWLCKRRAERDYRNRLAALGLGPLAIKPGGLDRWEVPRERVVINRKLGTGAFGTVYGGHALLAEDRGWSAVAVKTLKAGATTEEKVDFLSEAEAMKRFDHKNVVRLLGVVTKTEPVCTVMEFMLYGDLKNYLLARRHLAGSLGAESEEVSATRLTSMALDAARALSYLAQLRYVHRDVAARNCLVSANRVVKLGDFGMTRLVFEHDYYRFSRKGMLPVRWMAPESLALGVFSPASDVWSFGVLLYEIVTFGSLPFQGFSNSEVLTRVKGGHTLELPLGLKPQLEGLIKSCWRQDHRTRPAASEVAAFLADSPRLLTPCLDVPLDAMPLEADAIWRMPRDRAEARWVSWGSPASASTDTTYLSTDGHPADTDAFLPPTRAIFT